MTEQDETTVIHSIEPLLERYDGFLIDQWGVLHHGVSVLPGVNQALLALHRADKQVYIISNSGKRAATNTQRMAELGINIELCNGVISSGEVTWLGLKNKQGDFFTDLGERCLLFSRGGDQSAVAGLDLLLVDSARQADFIFLSGLNPSSDYLTNLQTQLTIALNRELPMLCSNPDTSTIEKQGLAEGPGAYAQRYASAGGKVHFIGKPWPAIYAAALDKMALASERIVAIGDSLQHDITGAAGMGMDAVLITEGIHRRAFADASSDNNLLQGLTQLLNDKLAKPRWLMRELIL